MAWPSKKPTIYHPRGEHANHYTSDAVANIYYATKVLKKKEEKKYKKFTLKVSDYCFIFQPCHGECNFFSWDYDDDVRFVIDQQTELQVSMSFHANILF